MNEPTEAEAIYGGARAGMKGLHEVMFRGPLQLALRDAGLPETPESLMVLETIALKAKLVLPGHPVSLKAFRRAARLYRKLATNPRQVPTVPEMSRTAAKKALMKAQSIPTGRQWKKWKKLQRRAQQGGV